MKLLSAFISGLFLIVFSFTVQAGTSNDVGIEVSGGEEIGIEVGEPEGHESHEEGHGKEEHVEEHEGGHHPNLDPLFFIIIGRLLSLATETVVIQDYIIGDKNPGRKSKGVLCPQVVGRV